ncbi:S66 peptidase family protein [Hufsiella ginkgonis]|uniref:LD-carboxypeptidase n=1 Tax=Hufsiella ginkgonis TaxID=2695274 RepID=A0A7K1XSL1_9SPHI|nr:LD-carboxypeptidase [Hufsiella ginkgonis]MXV13991.1 LD-carboxypeptidase [Hufsiella ginkgonis]
MILPPYLKPGDKVAITCPAKKLPGDIKDAVQLLESWGLEVVLGETVTASWHQFAGTDEQRRADLQRFMDDASVSAIIAARGGYGTIRIVDHLDFIKFVRRPKWIVGFSDITVLHSHLQARFGIASVHGQMPLTVPDSTKPSLESLRKALFGENVGYEYTSSHPNRGGSASAELTGGNLTLLMVLNGSVSEVDFTGKILFLEDVGEQLYSVDRMLYHLDRAGKLSGLAGLIVGGFTSLKDDVNVPFGQTAEEIIAAIVEKYDYPVCFNFPAGHIDDNRALVLGKTAHLTVTGQEVKLILD